MRLTLLKIVGGLFIIGISAWYLVPRAEALMEPQKPVVNGERGLIIISTEGGDRPLALHVDQRYFEDGTSSLVFFFTAKDLTYGEGGNVRSVDVVLNFVGDEFGDGMKCGLSQAPPGVDWKALEAGPRKAIEVDAVSKRGSALNFGGTQDYDSMIKELEGGRFLEYRATMWPLEEDSWRDGRSADEKGNVFAEECTMPERASWRTQSDETLTTSGKRTLLPPQLNWTSITPVTEFQTTMWSRIEIERGDEMALSEAYPEPKVDDDLWLYDQRVNWSKELRQEANLAYTDQPVFLFTERSFYDKQAILMLWSGVVLGIVATTLVKIGSLILELLFAPRPVSSDTTH